MEPKLRALVMRALDGDGKAYSELLISLSAYLRGYFTNNMGANKNEAEDLVQETILAIHLRLDSFERTRPFSPWAYAIARYKLIDYFRRTGCQTTVPLEDVPALFAFETSDETMARNDVVKLLSHLPEHQRNLVVDVKLRGLSVQEVAENTNLTISAVKVRIHRALKTLSGLVSHENE